MSSTPVSTSGPNVVVVCAMVIALCILCLGTAPILINRHYRKSVRKVDAEVCVKDGARSVRPSPTSSGFGRVSGNLQLPARVKVAASSRLRDSVVGTAIGRLSYPEAGRVKRTPLAPIQEEPVDIEAILGLDKLPDVAAVKEWSLYVPRTGVVAAAPSVQAAAVIPDIVVHSPTDPQLPLADSAGSMYSQGSWDVDHSGASDDPPSPWTPELDASSVTSSPDIGSQDLETPKVEFQLPLQLQATLSPATLHYGTSPGAYFDLERTDEGGAQGDDHLIVTGQPFTLRSSTSASSTTTQVRRPKTVFGQSSSTVTVGLGLRSGTIGPVSTSSTSLSEALDMWAQETVIYESLAFRAASDACGRLAYVDADGRTNRGHPVYGYGYL
ncbi:hypothetical protein C8T65DRAFT_727161 [Cerioporus squamosus]|nr:hypothetical protein C8T65DRAFT_727161 [Cerioporus squamosus]